MMAANIAHLLKNSEQVNLIGSIDPSRLVQVVQMFGINVEVQKTFKMKSAEPVYDMLSNIEPGIIGWIKEKKIHTGYLLTKTII